jgi:hypothetical protein
MMKNAWVRLLVVGGILGLAPLATADTLQYLGTVNGVKYGTQTQVAVTPYIISVNGVETRLICDDYSTYIPGSNPWTATALTFDQLNLARFSVQSNYVQKYHEVAFLADQLLNLPIGTIASPTNQEQQINLAYAIWSVFTPTALNNVDASRLGDVNSLVAAAKAATEDAGVFDATNIDVSKFVIYRPVGVPDSQEFIGIRAAEASALGALGLNLSALGVLGYIFRKRISRLG